MKKRMLVLILSGLSGVATIANGKAATPPVVPYDEWYFNFVYPKTLPAKVTYVELLDMGGWFYQFRTLGSTNASPGSIGRWSDQTGGGISSFNKAKNPPQFIHFCWDSVIDKKVYETRITFSGDVWKMMLTPYPSARDASKKRYHRFLVIGLAPEGTVRVWLENDYKPNIPLTHDKNILVETVSGAQLKMCKGVTRSDFSYPYDDDIVDFIKGKKYPYGEW